MGEENSGMHPSFINVLKKKEAIKRSLSGVKHKIGVYSAKGGVGKTTVSINLAYALSRMGYKVGLLDADIDCPNVPAFLNIDDKMDISRIPLVPILKNGVKIASTAMLVDDSKKPIIWRGPLVAKMLEDFFEKTDWGELDYLVMDLPPGTSDAPLSILQLVDMRGFIIVTGPGRVSAMDSKKSALMVKRFGVSILGVVENMSDNNQGRNSEEVARDVGSTFLGFIPRDRRMAEMDALGNVPVLSDEHMYNIFKGIIEKSLLD